MACCHSEPFDLLRENSAENLCKPSKHEILRRFAPQNDNLKGILLIDINSFQNQEALNKAPRSPG
jgi:hypothetical protein